MPVATKTLLRRHQSKLISQLETSGDFHIYGLINGLPKQELADALNADGALLDDENLMDSVSESHELAERIGMDPGSDWLDLAVEKVRHRGLIPLSKRDAGLLHKYYSHHVKNSDVSDWKRYPFTTIHVGALHAIDAAIESGQFNHLEIWSKKIRGVLQGYAIGVIGKTKDEFVYVRLACWGQGRKSVRDLRLLQVRRRTYKWGVPAVVSLGLLGLVILYLVTPSAPQSSSVPTLAQIVAGETPSSSYVPPPPSSTSTPVPTTIHLSAAHQQPSIPSSTSNAVSTSNSASVNNAPATETPGGGYFAHPTCETPKMASGMVSLHSGVRHVIGWLGLLALFGVMFVLIATNFRMRFSRTLRLIAFGSIMPSVIGLMVIWLTPAAIVC